MRIPKKRCLCCHRWFSPHPRTAAIQKFCSRKKCRQGSRRRSHGTWWRRNGRDTNISRRGKVRAWAGRRDYWRRYRAAHPAYVHRDNQRRRASKQKARRAAKQDTIRQIAVHKLRDIQAISSPGSAKQDMIHRRVEGLLDYLFWKEGSAKQDVMVLVNAPA